MHWPRAYRLVSVVVVLLTLIAVGAAVAGAVERPPVAPVVTAAAEPPSGYFQRGVLDGGSTSIYVNDAASDPAHHRVYLSGVHTGLVAVNSATATSIGTVSLNYLAEPLVLNPDGSRLFAYAPYYNEHVYVYNSSTLAEVTHYPVAAPLRYMAASSRGRLYTSEGNFTEHAVHVYDAASGAELAQIPQPDSLDRYGACLAVHGDRLYAAFNYLAEPYRMILAVYDISGPTPVELQSKSYDDGAIELDVSPDGSFLVARRTSGLDVDVYNTADLSHLARLEPRNDDAPDEFYIQNVAISADNQLIHLHHNQGVYSYNSASYQLERLFRYSYLDYGGRMVVPLEGQDMMLAGSHFVRFYSPERGRAYLPELTYNYCRSYFSDDFSNPASGWPVADNGDVRYAYENGQYRILFRDKEIWSGLSRGDLWDDSRLLGIDGHLADGSGWWGLIFFIQGDWSHFYTVEINPHLQMYLSTEYSDATGWTLLHVGESEAIQPAGGWNRLEVKEMDDVTFAVTVNGAYLGHTFAEEVGYMGLTASSLERNTDFRFDNYVFAARNCPIPGETPGAQSAPPPLELSRPDLPSR